MSKMLSFRASDQLVEKVDEMVAVAGVDVPRSTWLREVVARAAFGDGASDEQMHPKRALELQRSHGLTRGVSGESDPVAVKVLNVQKRSLGKTRVSVAVPAPVDEMGVELIPVPEFGGGPPVGFVEKSGLGKPPPL